MANRVGIAILGCGYWGVNYLRVFSELPNARVVAVCDARPERLQEVGSHYSKVALTLKIEEALQMDGVEAAVICTQAVTHYDIARQCLAKGKHILIEKPMTTGVAEAQQLITLAQAQGVALMVGHTFLYNAGIRKVKQYIAEGKIGWLYYLYARRTNLGPIRRDINALWDLAAHDVSIFNYLLDSIPSWVSAVGCKVLRNGREDAGFISIGYPDGIVGHIHVSWADPSKVREVVVVGSDMRIVFDDLNTLEQVRVFEKGIAPTSSEASSYGEYHFQMRNGDIISPRIEISEPLKNQCAHFLECIVQGKRPFTGGLEGLAVVQVMAAIDQSIAQRGEPVEIIWGDNYASQYASAFC
jgi:predicted dehydrogenase